MGLGIDLCMQSRIEKLMQNEVALKKIFLPSELTDDVKKLSGIFAAKEAYFKAIGKKGDWLSIEVVANEQGKPYFKNDNAQLSITHEGEYSAAVVFFDDN